jgi:hypothetical protein
MKHFLCALAGGLALLVMAHRSASAPRVEADPNKLYPISPDVGQWVICAASYMGEDARELARQTIHQLRRRDNLPAYFYDYSEQERREMQNYLNGRKGKVRIQDQCGVLIGGFKDEKSARDGLNDVKKLKMPELDLGSQKSAYDTTVDPATGRRLKISPFANAFVTRNPTVPRAQQEQEKDPFLKSLNDGEKYSLLKNPKPWTLAIKGYACTTAYTSGGASPSLLEKLWPSNNSADVLGASAAQAHELARILRELGMDAWVLHLRKQSLVTVGGFDGPDDPKLQQTILKVRAWQERNVKTLGTDPFQILETPFPVRVPKA